MEENPYSLKYKNGTVVVVHENKESGGCGCGTIIIILLLLHIISLLGGC